MDRGTILLPGQRVKLLLLAGSYAGSATLYFLIQELSKFFEIYLIEDVYTDPLDRFYTTMSHGSGPGIREEQTRIRLCFEDNIKTPRGLHQTQLLKLDGFPGKDLSWFKQQIVENIHRHKIQVIVTATCGLIIPKDGLDLVAPEHRLNLHPVLGENSLIGQSIPGESQGKNIIITMATLRSKRPRAYRVVVHRTLPFPEIDKGIIVGESGIGYLPAWTQSEAVTRGLGARDALYNRANQCVIASSQLYPAALRSCLMREVFPDPRQLSKQEISLSTMVMEWGYNPFQIFKY